MCLPLTSGNPSSLKLHVKVLRFLILFSMRQRIFQKTVKGPIKVRVDALYVLRNHTKFQIKWNQCVWGIQKLRQQEGVGILAQHLDFCDYRVENVNVYNNIIVKRRREMGFDSYGMYFSGC